MKFFRILTCLVLALIPFVVLIYFVAEYMVDVPYWDQWELPLLLEKSFQGSLSFNDLMKQHNEHRPLFPLVIMMVLARLSGWAISYELVVNILLGVGIFLTITYQLRKTGKCLNNDGACWPVPIISLMVFSLTQSENWLWGWQIQMFLNILAVSAGIVLLANYAERWLHFILALFMGIIGTYSFAYGLIYWFIGLLILVFVDYRDKKNKIHRIIVWAAASFIIICTYMYKYHKPEGHPPVFLFVKYPIKYTMYILAYLGTPVCRFQVDGAMLFGLFGLIICGYLIWALMKSRNIKARVFLPFMALSLYSIGSAGITGIGRLGFTYGHALTSRYATVSNLLWISNIALCYLLTETRKVELKNKIGSIGSAESGADEIYRLCRDETLSQVKRVFVLTIVVLFIIYNSAVATLDFKARHAWLAPARNELLQSTGNEELFTHLYPKPEVVKVRREILKEYKLSVFRE